jgi:hypothetical protein
MVTAGKLDVDAAAKVLAAAEAEVRTLEEENTKRSTPAEEKRRNAAVCEQARAVIKRLQEKIAAAPERLVDSAHWHKVEEAWKFCMPLAKTGSSTNAQRRQADSKLKGAKEAVGLLLAAGLLSKPESELLRAQAGRIREDIYRNPPIDERGTCYDMAFIHPAQRSYKRLQKRLPLLKRLADSGKVHGSVLERLLITIEADLKVLSGEKGSKAADLRDAVKAELAKLKKLVGAPK